MNYMSKGNKFNTHKRRRITYYGQFLIRLKFSIRGFPMHEEENV